MILILFFCFLYIVLQLLDIYTTITILKKNGTELNPVLNWLFIRFDILPTLLIVKFLSCFILVLFWNLWIFIVGCVIYSLVVCWNLYQIWKIK